MIRSLKRTRWSSPKSAWYRLGVEVLCSTQIWIDGPIAGLGDLHRLAVLIDNGEIDCGALYTVVLVVGKQTAHGFIEAIAQLGHRERRIVFAGDLDFERI